MDIGVEWKCHSDDLLNFKKHFQYLQKLYEHCKENPNRRLVMTEEDCHNYELGDDEERIDASDLIFTIQNLWIQESGCHQCKAVYPCIYFEGHLYPSQAYPQKFITEQFPDGFETSLDTYHYFDCFCPSHAWQIGLAPERKIHPYMFFKFFPCGNRYVRFQWIQTCLYINDKTIQLK